MAEVQGVFEQAVLIAVATLARESSGSTILAEVRERLKRNVHSGSVHSTLRRLEVKRLVTSRKGTTPDRGGRPRRYYGINEAGIGALRRARMEIQKAWGDFVVAER
ncbi:MAG: PadR family transcriptional regulator, regulatory protein PadR [Thermoanaerobaculia bacterium]|jgi:DNA-binding PadR family transcriptional regulator|nr:PadR family transcriptional regulator, regulatory protein PadR [Thermoanaerobaculia bacterium]